MKTHLYKRLVLILILFLPALANGQNNNYYVLDMVHHNPGEPSTKSAFTDPSFLKEKGYNGQVVNDFTFAHAALTFDKLSKEIFPDGSEERKWVEQAAKKVKENIAEAHAAGIKIYYFTDIIVLPKRLVDIYKDEITDKDGKISFERPKTVEIHRMMLNELFDTFPDLDGLVIRTGETYLNNVPHHTGNGPITNGPASHVKLINLLRDEVCVKRNKMLFYRTWSFGGMHEQPDYYLKVTDQIQPHPNLVFAIKHTKGDYQRTFDFNPTLTLGKHPQIIEVQCQREYEGKGAYPDYVMEGVINGFEEYSMNKPQPGYKSLKEIKSSPNFRGVWSWSRGGGWVGPYITNEFWCRLNALVISKWALDPKQSEEEVFNKVITEMGIQGKSRERFRELALLSAKAVIRGHSSVKYPFQNSWTWWMRDEFLSGTDPNYNPRQFSSEGLLYKAFTQYYKDGILHGAVQEKYEAVELWKNIEKLSRGIKMKDKEDESYVRVSSTYGMLLHQIIAEGWKIMALGFEGDKTGKYDIKEMHQALLNYDKYWKLYKNFKETNPSSATLYKPYSFEYIAPTYHAEKGMGASVNYYRKIIADKQ
ncbi:hypothetical protein [Desertivirga brevis]|uniref:hypothetical protein n=1 Tax=Desertivirga brevis TaxID=2810310 RepID=UPI001A972579|nr:hypothetical protein [Pedobacter sp. SYSU D00873]